MKLIDDWVSVMLKAWSVRFLTVAGLLQLLDLLGAFGDMLPFLEGVLPEHTFRWLSILCTVAAFAARLIQQQGLEPAAKDEGAAP